MLIGLKKDNVDIFGNALFKLLLQIAATVLVFAQTKDFSLKSLELDIIESSIFYKESAK